MVEIKTFAVNFEDTDTERDTEDIDIRINGYLQENKIKYDDIKKLQITTVESNPSSGGESSTNLRGRAYLIYTLIIEKTEENIKL